jgi:hypothetical protein
MSKEVTGDVLSEVPLDGRVSELESLVEELLKEQPSEEDIQKKMKALEIEYSQDPIERINRVLEALHPYHALDFEE